MQHDPQRASGRYTSTEAERLLRQRAALADFGAAALASTDLDGVLTEGARLCAEGMGVPYCKVLEYRPGTNDLIFRAGVGWQPGMIGRAVARAEDSNPGGRAFRTGLPVIVADLRGAEGMDLPASCGCPDGDEPGSPCRCYGRAEKLARVRPATACPAPARSAVRSDTGRPGDVVEARMTLKLVSSGDDRALAIRDRLLPLVREHGTLELQRGPVRLVVLRTGPWTVEHWTPFGELSPGEASSPGYRHALERQRARPDLPYGLDVRRDGARVLRVLWSDDGATEVAAFVRGSWEDAALALAL